MSFLKRVFNDHVELFEYIKSEAINQGWFLKHDGDDDGDTSKRVLILRDPLDRFDSCFRIYNDTYNDYTYVGDVDIQTCLDYDVTRKFKSQPSGDSDNHSVSFKTNLNISTIISISSARITAMSTQNGLNSNFYTGRIDSYKSDISLNEDLVTLSTFNKSSQGSVEYTRNDSFLNDGSVYSLGVWKRLEFAFTDFKKVQPNNGYFTFFPLIVKPAGENRVFGELSGVYGISAVGILPNSVFNFNTVDYHVFDSNESTPNYLVLKGA